MKNLAPDNQFNHTKERLKQRYKLDINKEEYIDLCQRLKESFISRPYSKNRDVRMTVFKGKIISIGYNHKRELINTVLPNRKKDFKYYKIYKQIFR